ncbi:2-hydroxyhepta-2,4-diene-1,7-dioate isomerase [Sulfobacillus sp. DSM 109850]|uniref:2-hydroxyhepta-2,4-diene-1,7-dioate isomerase n=2 Tax=Sulfobacillus harzensis TaxID=2729629 RepID=A0A7Y0L0M3_9FIRM|nr:2-hydroxyhepta-2,4-diene-1,7-dioate isomerase [Sulfobacillus harzensis]
MRWVRFLVDGQEWEGQWVEGQIVTQSGPVFADSQVKWLPPVNPSKIIGLALNYRNHAAELGLEEPPEPALFFKPPSALIGHRQAIVYPTGASYCHYETEVAVVMGRRCRRIKANEALDYVRGYTIANDFTCRDFIRNTFRPPVRAKGFDTFCPLGPAIVSREMIDNPDNLEIVTRVNGTVRQTGNTRQLMMSIPEIIAYLASFMTLEPGDVILTGTPEGISPVEPGDVIVSEIEGLGALHNPVVAEGGGQ